MDLAKVVCSAEKLVAMMGKEWDELKAVSKVL